MDESKPFEYVVDVLKAVDPNKHGIKYFLDSVEPIINKNKSNEASFNLGAKKENEPQSNYIVFGFEPWFKTGSNYHRP